jgi:hypothetical protein
MSMTPHRLQAEAAVGLAAVANAADKVVDANHIALRPAPMRKHSRIANFGIASLRARAMHIH